MRVVAIDDRGAVRAPAPRKISALARAISSTLSKNSRWTGSTVVTIATCGRTSLRQRRDLAGVVHADLEDAEASRRRHAREASAARPSDC